MRNSLPLAAVLLGLPSCVLADHGDALLLGQQVITASLGYSFELSEALTLTAAYGTAYRAPTSNDLYYPASAFTAGNPDVKPEESQSYELGIRGSHGWGEWSVNAYENQIDDLIVWAGTSPMRPENVDVARIRGIETSAPRCMRPASASTRPATPRTRACPATP
ncbi:Vitamin B12 transporter BtuB [Stutzerimonas stutzeri]